ncbi:MAG: energy transducer TonB [Xanthomonadales bacterium]
MRLLRVLIAALLAMAVTFGLFLFMHKLISSGGSDRIDPGTIAGIYFGPVDIPDEVISKSRRKPRKPPPPKDPPPPKMQISRMDQQVQDMPRINIPKLDVPLIGGGGMFLGNFQQVDRTAEGDIIPIVVIRPIYPHEAAMSGIEGWVKIEFTITALGTVRNPRVVDARPARVFNRAAILAILKWKFKPRVVAGVAVDRRASQVIDFTLDDALR